MRIHLRILFLVLTTISLLVYADDQILDVQANGRTVPIVEIEEYPYVLEIKIFPPTPRVGNFHINVVISDMVNKEPTTGASVSLVAVGPGPDNLTVGPAKAHATLLTPNSYETTLSIPHEGNWRLILDISHEGATIRTELPLQFVPSNINLGLIFVIMCSIPILISVSWYVRKKVYKI